MSGTLVGPAFGPFLGGLIVTYTSWRVIFWLQTGLAGLATIGVYFLVPETIYHKKIDDLAGYSGREKGRALISMLNPWRVLRLFQYPSTYYRLAYTIRSALEIQRTVKLLTFDDLDLKQSLTWSSCRFPIDRSGQCVTRLEHVRVSIALLTCSGSSVA